MNTIRLTILLILTVTYCYSQKKFGIKIYQNTDMFNAEYNDWRNKPLTRDDYVNFNRLSLAVNIISKNTFAHEIEFLIPEISKSTNNIQFPMKYEFEKDITFDSKASVYSMRYELSKALLRQSKRFNCTLGLGINPYYVHIEYIPNVATSYYHSDKLYGAVINIIPRMNYKINNRFSMDLNLPLRIFDLREETVRTRNPSIPIRQQTINTTHGIFFESAYTVRLGLTYSFH